MDIALQKFNEAKVIAKALDNKIRKMQAARLAPTHTDLIPTSRLLAIFEEAQRDFERDLDRMEWESHKNDGLGTEELTPDEREAIGF